MPDSTTYKRYTYTATLAQTYSYRIPYIDTLTQNTLTTDNQRTHAGCLCRETLLSLGPTFIKVGQLFSTRSDLFSAAFTDELAKLQDRVPAFAPDKAVAIIESELGAPVSQLFRSFQKQPIAAASLGQVRHVSPAAG